MGHLVEPGLYQVALELIEIAGDKQLYVAHLAENSDLTEILSARRLVKKGVEILAAGGFGEAGSRNCLVIEDRDMRIFLDCGVRPAYGPDQEEELPDLSTVEGAKETIINITDAHRDHAAGLGPMIQFLASNDLIPDGDQPKVVATTQTAEIIRLVDFPNGDAPEITDLRDVLASRIDAGGMVIRPVKDKFHSIPGSVGYTVETPQGIIFWPGDFKCQLDKSIDLATTVRSLKEVTKRGVRVVFIDTTNIMKPGFTPSEMLVYEEMAEIIEQAPARVIVASFASNVKRTQEIIKVAEAFGKTVALAGGTATYYAACRAAGGPADRLEFGTLSDADVVICPGCQAERSENQAAFLVKAVYDEWPDQPQLILRQDDTVVISAMPIPGNRQRIKWMVEKLLRKRCHVVVPEEFTGLSSLVQRRKVHVSGHPNREDVRLYLDYLRSDGLVIVPWHGDEFAAFELMRLAEEMGLKPHQTRIMRTGERWIL
jgi:ribonuclease J